MYRHIFCRNRKRDFFLSVLRFGNLFLLQYIMIFLPRQRKNRLNLCPFLEYTFPSFISLGILGLGNPEKVSGQIGIKVCFSPSLITSSFLLLLPLYLQFSPSRQALTKIFIYFLLFAIKIKKVKTNKTKITAKISISGFEINGILPAIPIKVARSIKNTINMITKIAIFLLFILSPKA